MIAERETTWVYTKIYVPPDNTDAVLVGSILDVVRRYGARIDVWFYLRFFDERGAHIRFRCLTDLDTADEMASTDFEWGRPNTAIAMDLYEPETGKWGDGSGLRASERVFQISSEIALRLLASASGIGDGRLATGIIFIIEIAQTIGLSVEQRRGFVETHFNWWSGNAALSSERYAEISSKLDEAIPGIRAFFDDSGSRENARVDSRRFAESVAASFDEMSDARRSVLYFAHQHLHLMLNRLGLSPLDEAAVALGVLDEQFALGCFLDDETAVAEQKGSISERKENAKWIRQ